MTTHEPTQRFDIAIVGASLTGLTLARAIAVSLGGEVSVAMLDRRKAKDGPATAADPRAFALGAGSCQLLQAIGVWPAIADAACAVTRIDITDSSLRHAVRPVLLSYENRIDGDAPASTIVPADVLRRALWDAIKDAHGVTVIAPCEVVSHDADETGRHLELDNGRVITASLMVAAGAGAPQLREAAGIGAIGWPHDQIGIVATVAHERPHGGCATQHFLPAGPFAALPLNGNRSCVTWTEAAEPGRAIMALDDAGFLAELEQRFGHRLGDLHLVGARASWPLELSVARNLIARRFALVGDAARTMHPIAGQGLNHGLRDVAALTQAIAEVMRVGLEAGDGAALERYERWRRFDSSTSAAAFEAINAVFANDAPLLRSVRDAGVGLVERLPALKALIVSEAAGLTGDVPRLLLGELP